MTLHHVSKPFEPGTTGWSADDLDDPQIERLWLQGRYEIIEGVLTTMPPAYFDTSVPLGSLIRIIDRYLDATGREMLMAPETDLVLGPRKVVRVDAVYLTRDDLERQKAGVSGRPAAPSRRRQLCVPPTLAIECVSAGHEAHDRETKLEWYAEFGIANYWLLDPCRRTLECLCLSKGAYHTDRAGQEDDQLHPSLFPGLTIALTKLWL